MHAANSAMDDMDRALVHALQLAPRASWERLAPVLGARPDTLARRWERLTGSGDAWISALGLRTGRRSPCMAWVEIGCTPGSAPAVGRALTDDPHTLGLEHVTGARDLLAFVAVPDLHALYRYLSLRVQRIPGVVTTRSSMVTAVHYAPDRWRLDLLNPAQVARLTDRPVRPPAVPGSTALTEEDRPLVLALSSDARRSVASLARQFGMSESTVRRRLARLETGHGLRFSCALAARLSGWPVAATVWAEVSEYEVADCAAAAAGIRETRMCMSVSGPWNFMISARLRAVEDLHRYTAELLRRLPGLRITDTAVALHTRKSEAQVLDQQGRRVRCVVPDIWSDPAPGAGDGEPEPGPLRSCAA
ncbi:Lrp/AsnC family transcriptional regulator [Streptomyces bambusae]|uniref:Lrp/AsnC family transcriptional regulator n=1 Tax=Streptomyces bambusae TaxID=1550616 RepID=UPI001CFFD980|nr:Lrp/AsnC family transcriptional regulator [Streptomyces bambusae]MCB5169549.1 Lrp/AsnC family transcriptional regulator [Streptomyces bambusae]